MERKFSLLVTQAIINTSYDSVLWKQYLIKPSAVRPFLLRYSKSPAPVLCVLPRPCPALPMYRAYSYPWISWGLKMGVKQRCDILFHPSWQTVRLHREQHPWRVGKNCLGRTAGTTKNLELAVWIHISPWHLSQSDVHLSGKGWPCEFPTHMSNNAL